ncbi:MAG: glycosyltransferase family 4 protein [Candidatus Paceibacterota bacterium]|jgi:glycosyltransferase involved in cell wall biosynthesis
MKILIATGIYPPSIGGPATYSKILFDELPKRGIGAAVFSFDEVRHLPKVISHIAYFFKVLAHGVSCDIIYAQDPISVGLPALFAAKILRKRFFLKVVGDYAWEQGAQRFGVTDLLDEFSKEPLSGYSAPVRFLRKAESFVARRAERVIVPSRYLKKIVTRWGVPEERICVIYNALEGVAEPGNEEHPKILLSGKSVVSAGRLVPWKGFLSLVETMIELTKKFPDLKLYIIGDGPERETIERRIKQLELGRNVHLVGGVPQKMLFEYIRAGSIFALNTGYEGFSHQLLEVMALGVPLVTTNVGGNPEIVREGENGLLVPYDDKRALAQAIEKMLRDEDFAAKCAASGKSTAALFTKERMVGDLVKILA